MTSCTIRVARKLCLLILLIFLLPRSLLATSVLAVDVEQLVEESALIFEGEIISSEARWNPEQTSIATHVTFQVLDIIKGSIVGDTVTVTFAGGTVDGMTLRVDDMAYPEPGERGIYFLENPARQQFNPLLGWNQGRFLIRQDSSGKERVMTATDVPVLDIGETAVASGSLIAGKQSGQLPLSRGAAQGLRLGNPADDRTLALEKNVFKQTLREHADALSSIRTAAPRKGQRP